jgi:hypothetical protein
VTRGTDWSAWHADYLDPSSPLSARLRVVQEHVAGWLDATTGRHVTVLSSCAGDGRDILDVLSDREDAGRVSGTLLEANPTNAGRAAERARRLGLSGFEVRCTDAGSTSAYVGAVPADLVLLCAIFGNIEDDDVRRTVAAAPQLCAAGATVVWTRHRRAPDLTPSIRQWFQEDGFEEVDFVAPRQAMYSVGVHRMVGDPQELVEGRRLFAFVR